MSRPRRFGKSLFLDTLKEVFQGNKKLFKECQIYNSNYDWEEHPVILFDFSRISSRSSSELEESLKRRLKNIAIEYALSVDTPTIQEGLEALFTGLAKKHNKAVVLVDEYDKPIVDVLQDAVTA